MVLKFRFPTKWDLSPTDSLAGLARRRSSRGEKTSPQGEWFWGSRFFREPYILLYLNPERLVGTQSSNFRCKSEIKVK